VATISRAVSWAAAPNVEEREPSIAGAARNSKSWRVSVSRAAQTSRSELRSVRLQRDQMNATLANPQSIEAVSIVARRLGVSTVNGRLRTTAANSTDPATGAMTAY
jgi:hypothetical protein